MTRDLPSRRWPICGAWVNLFSQAQLLELLVCSRHGHSRVIANHNLHSLHLQRVDPGMRSFYCLADAVHVDGRPLLLLTRLLGAPSRPYHLQTSVDFLMPLLQRLALAGKRVFLLGGQPGVVERFLTLLGSTAPGLCVEGHHGYFPASGPASTAVVAKIRAFAPDLLLLGMGMPRQEQWFVDNRHSLPACTVMNLGAFMDRWVGEKSMAPRWIGRLGFEWAWRLVHEPRHVAYRYLVEPFHLIEPFLGCGRRILVPDHRRSLVSGKTGTGSSAADSAL